MHETHFAQVTNFRQLVFCLGIAVPVTIISVSAHAYCMKCYLEKKSWHVLLQKHFPV